LWHFCGHAWTGGDDLAINKSKDGGEGGDQEGLELKKDEVSVEKGMTD
jgi:hypothetical protein